MIDTDLLNSIMDSRIAPGTVLESVLCPSGRDQAVKIRLKSRHSGKTTTFSVKPSDDHADIARTVVRMSNELIDSDRNPNHAAAKQKSLLPA
jgi:hypothetical protein